MPITDKFEKIGLEYNDKLKNIICKTNWHKKYLLNKIKEKDPELYSKVYNKVIVIGNGIYLPRFNHDGIKKQPWRFIYSSCPTRGARNLVRMIPKIRKIIPEAEFHFFIALTCPYYKDFHRISELKEQLENTPGVIIHPRISQEELAKEMIKSDIWLYPTRFKETYCITALEMQMAGVLCIYSNNSCLDETVGDRGVLVNVDPDLEENDKYFIQVIDDLVHNKIDKKDYIKRGCTWAVNQSWDNIIKKFLKLLDEIDNAGPIQIKYFEQCDIPKEHIIREKSFKTFSNQEQVMEHIIAKSDKYTKKSNRLHMDRVYIVNLHQRNDRWKDIYEYMNKLDISISRWEAIDGYNMDLPLLAELAIKNNDFKSQAGPLGCGWSHIELWHYLLSSPTLSSFMIFEDDVSLVNNFNEKWEEYYKHLPSDWEFVYLGGPTPQKSVEKKKPGQQVNNYYIIPDVLEVCGTFAYAVNKKGAAKLLDKYNREGFQYMIDKYILDCFDSMKVYMCWPNIAYSLTNSDSDVTCNTLVYQFKH